MTITILEHRRNRRRTLDFLDEARVTYLSDSTLGVDASGKPDLEPRRHSPRLPFKGFDRHKKEEPKMQALPRWWGWVIVMELRLRCSGE